MATNTHGPFIEEFFKPPLERFTQDVDEKIVEICGRENAPTEEEIYLLCEYLFDKYNIKLKEK